MDFNCELPINSLSLGNVSINFLKEFYRRNLQPCIFPIGGVDIGSFNKLDDDFKFWLTTNINKSLKFYKRTNPCFKIWHINGGQNSISDKQILYTFHELDVATDFEINIVKNNRRVVFSSNFSREVFAQFCENVTNCPLGFDSDSFYLTNKRYLPKEITVFTLGGKLEKRKHHLKIINWWVKKYGNDKRHVLNCALFNQFMKPEDQNAMLTQALEGKRYFNVNFLPYMHTNEAYNDFLNASNIDLTGLSGAEGFNLPSFQQACLGKWPIVLDAHGHKEWATAENAILVKPSGKEEAVDGIFFAKNGAFNQGNIFTFDQEAFNAACDEAVKRHEKGANEEGLKLKDKFTWAKSADFVLKELAS